MRPVVGGLGVAGNACNQPAVRICSSSSLALMNGTLRDRATADVPRHFGDLVD
jgi:hypothetical protein